MISLMILRGVIMKRIVEGADRGQSTLLPECLDDWIDEENPVRVIDALDLADLGFDGVEPAATGRPAFQPSVLLIYIYGYLNRVQSSRGDVAQLRKGASLQRSLVKMISPLSVRPLAIQPFRK